MCKYFGRGGEKIVKGWRLAMLDGREAMRLSVSLREGSDLKRSLADKGVPISIHAPAPRGISPCMNCSVSNMPAKKTTVNYSKLLKISVKSHRFY